VHAHASAEQVLSAMLDSLLKAPVISDSVTQLRMLSLYCCPPLIVLLLSASALIYCGINGVYVHVLLKRLCSKT
jgi:hypothetical protein